MRVLIAGASGFIGSYVVPALSEHELVLLSRNPERLRFGGVRVKFEGERLEEIVKAQKPDVVINLIGILKESGRETFEKVHYTYTRKLVDGARASGCRLFVQMSALGCSLNSRSRYKRTKALAEDCVRRSGLDYTIVKPSIVMGKGQLLFNDVKKFSAITPVFLVPKFRVQPVNVRDVRDFIVKAVNEKITGEFEMCGSRVVSMKELFEFVLKCIGRVRLVVEVPKQLLKPLALLGIGMTYDQYLMLDRDNVCTDKSVWKILGEPRDGLVCE